MRSQELLNQSLAPACLCGGLICNYLTSKPQRFFSAEKEYSECMVLFGKKEWSSRPKDRVHVNQFLAVTLFPWHKGSHLLP